MVKTKKHSRTRTKFIWCVISLVLTSGTPLSPCAIADLDPTTPFPAKPIKLVVYMKPGGLIDITARKFVAVAAKYSDATFVVENKDGAGGLVAIQKVQRQKADGHTLLACTKSNISKVVACNAEPYLANFHWLAFLMADPECVITHRHTNTASWEQLVADAKARPGEQLWLGPENGGLDHVTAMKIWEQAGITARWVPCSSGGEARGKLLGKQGAAYVGNPSEVLANPELTIAAVCSPERLPQFPDAPTFRELGLEGLEDEYMWRGIAVKRGTPQAVIDQYEDLFRKVSADPEWRSTWEKGGIDVRYEADEVFAAIVEQDRRDFRRYLSQIGLLQKPDDAKGWLASPLLAATVLVVAYVLIWSTRGWAKNRLLGDTLVLGLVTGVAAVCFLQTFAFPSVSSIGARTVPRMYAIAMLICVAVVAIGLSKLRGTNKSPNETNGNAAKVAECVFAILCYWLAVIVFGYLAATGVFLVVGLYRLGVRSHFMVGCVAFGWLLGSYLVFARALYVPLPPGILWESFS